MHNPPLPTDATFYLVYDLILAVIVISVVLTNGMVVFIYWYIKIIRSKTANLLLFNQALVDIFNGVVAGGITLFSAHSPTLLTAGVYQFSISLSFHTVTLISLERYAFILRPLLHRRYVTKYRISILVLASWFLSLAWIPARLVHYDDNNQLLDENNQLRSSFCWYVAVSNGVILLVMVFVGCLHALTYAEVKRHIVNRKKTSEARYDDNINEKTRWKHLNEMRVSKIFIAMFVAFVVTYSPLIVTGIIHIVGGFHESDYKYTALDILFYFVNSLFNPALTLMYKEDYRKVVHRFKRRLTNAWYLSCYNRSHSPSRSTISEDDVMLT